MSFFGHSVTEIFLVFLGTDILKRKHDDGFFGLWLKSGLRGRTSFLAIQGVIAAHCKDLKITQAMPRQSAMIPVSSFFPGMPAIWRIRFRSIARVTKIINGTSRTSTLTFPGLFSVPRNHRQTMVQSRAPRTVTNVRSIVSSGKS